MIFKQSKHFSHQVAWIIELGSFRSKSAPISYQTLFHQNYYIFLGDTSISMLARNVCTFSKNAMRSASLVSQIPCMKFSTDLKVEASEHKVFNEIL